MYDYGRQIASHGIFSLLYKFNNLNKASIQFIALALFYMLKDVDSLHNTTHGLLSKKEKKKLMVHCLSLSII